MPWGDCSGTPGHQEPPRVVSSSNQACFPPSGGGSPRRHPSCAASGPARAASGCTSTGRTGWTCCSCGPRSTTAWPPRPAYGLPPPLVPPQCSQWTQQTDEPLSGWIDPPPAGCEPGLKQSDGPPRRRYSGVGQVRQQSPSQTIAAWITQPGPVRPRRAGRRGSWASSRGRQAQRSVRRPPGARRETPLAVPGRRVRPVGRFGGGKLCGFQVLSDRWFCAGGSKPRATHKVREDSCVGTQMNTQMDYTPACSGMVQFMASNISTHCFIT